MSDKYVRLAVKGVATETFVGHLTQPGKFDVRVAPPTADPLELAPGELQLRPLAEVVGVKFAPQRECIEAVYPDGAPIRALLWEFSALYPHAVIASEYHDILDRVGGCYALQDRRVLVEFDSTHFLVDETCSTQIKVFDLYIPETLAEAADVKYSRACSDIRRFAAMFVNPIFTEHEYRRRNPGKTAQLEKAFEQAADSLNVLNNIEFSDVVWDIDEAEAQRVLRQRLAALRLAERATKNGGEDVGREGNF